MKKRVGSLLLSSAILLSSTASFAAEFDLIVKETGETHSIAKWTIDPRLQVHTGVSPEKYEFEFNDKKYEFKDIQRLMGEDKDLSLEEAAKILDGEEDELVVKSVSAISDTVNVGGTVTFKINREKEDADLKALDKAGYIVEFKSDQEVFEKTGDKSNDGKLKNEIEAGTKFNVEIHITPKEGDTIKSKRVEVTVEDEDEVVTSIDKVEIKDDEVVLEKPVLDLATKEYTLDVKGNTKSDKEDAEVKSLELGLFEASSSNVGVVKIGEDLKLIPVAKGSAKVTLKAKQGDVKEVLDITVADAGKIDKENSSIKPTSGELAIGQEFKVVLELKDEHGNPVSGKTIKQKEKTLKTVDLISEEDTEVKGTYNITLTGKAEGKEVITLVVDDIELGTIRLDVKKPGTEIAKYELSTKAKEDDLDLKGKKKIAVPVDIKGFDKDGVEVAAANRPSFDEDGEYVYSIKAGDIKGEGGEITFTEPGDYTIELSRTKGSLTDEKLATLDITIVDTTPTVTGIELVDKDYKITTKNVKTFDLNEVVKITADKDIEILIKDGKVYEVIKEKEYVEIGTIALDASGVVTLGNEGKVGLKEATMEEQEGKLSISLSNNDKVNVGTVEIDAIVEAKAE